MVASSDLLQNYYDQPMRPSDLNVVGKEPGVKWLTIYFTLGVPDSAPFTPTISESPSGFGFSKCDRVQKKELNTQIYELEV
jgi:hypothetical protein